MPHAGRVAGFQAAGVLAVGHPQSRGADLYHLSGAHLYRQLDRRRQKIITPDWDSDVVQAINDDPARTSGAYVISVPGRT